MHNMLRNATVVASAVLLFALVGCGGATSGMGRTEVYLTDATGPFDEVRVSIREISVHATGGWSTLITQEGLGRMGILQPINLLALASNPVLLGEGVLPVGHYTQMRLLLAVDNGANYVVQNGVRHNLTVPSGGETGLKLITGGFDVVSEAVTRLVLDWHVEDSIVSADGTYILKPTITVTVDQYTSIVGSVSGVVAPAGPDVWAYAYAATAAGLVVNGDQADPDTGAFQVGALPPGTYSLRFTVGGNPVDVLFGGSVVSQITGLEVVGGEDLPLSETVTIQ